MSPDTTGMAPIDANVIEETIATFIAEQTGTRPAPDQDLFATGLATSLFALQLVVFVEHTYSVTVAGSDLRLPNFRTVESMAALAGRLRAEAATDGDG
jgi:methoxymalonate biosynthesis acyl carrier protein